MQNMPSNIEIEKNLLGSALMDERILARLKDEALPEYFYDERNRVIFEHLREMEKADILLLRNSLKDNNLFNNLGGDTYLLEIGDSVVVTRNVEEQCKELHDLSIKRSLIRQLNETLEECYSSKKSTEILDNVSDKVFELAMGSAESDFKDFLKLAKDTLSEINELSKSGGEEVSGVATGFKELDEITCGLHGGDYILIGARPSMGKTSFAMNIAQNVAFRGMQHVAFFSLEMNAKSLMYRILASECKVEHKGLRTGILYPDEWEKLYNGSHRIMSLTDQFLHIEDNSMLTVHDISRKCKKLKMERGLDLVVIDYLQLIVGDGGESRQQEVSMISRQLKALAKEVDCPVVVLSQLSRLLEQRKDKRPIMSDLRESGAIEQDADIVMMLYRDEYYNEYSEDDFTELIIAKQRNGQTGTLKIDFNPLYCTFSDLE